jgi:hypothetical protein
MYGAIVLGRDERLRGATWLSSGPSGAGRRRRDGHLAHLGLSIILTERQPLGVVAADAVRRHGDHLLMGRA